MPPPEPITHRLGAKLRSLRLQRGISVRTFAAEVGFSPSFISQLEADQVSPSIASLEKIAGALGITLGELFSSLERQRAPRTIVRSTERTAYVSGWSNSTVTVVTDPAHERSMSAMELVIAPGGMSSRRPEARAYDTMAILHRGSLVLVLDDGEQLLTPGDSVYLLAGTPCSWVNRSEDAAVLLLCSAIGRADLGRATGRADADADALPQPGGPGDQGA
jgi:transcriptional regulator with XRE-family HTH domain